MNSTYTTHEAATQLGVHPRTLRSWCANGICGYRYSDRGAWLLDEKDLELARKYRDRRERAR